MHTTHVSLLQRLGLPGEQQAWDRFVELYTPLIYYWACHVGLQEQDAADLVQDVFALLLQKLPEFTYDPRRSFRSWLRTIVCSRTADYWRAIDGSTQAQGGSGATAALQQIADPDSELNRQWDEEHDRYVLHCLLDLVEEEFEPITLQAFRRLALDGVNGALAAQELGLSVAAVYAAKARVLARMRQEAEGLID